MNHNKEAKSLTFWRGSEVSQVTGCHMGLCRVLHSFIGLEYTGFNN